MKFPPPRCILTLSLHSSSLAAVTDYHGRSGSKQHKFKTSLFGLARSHCTKIKVSAGRITFRRLENSFPCLCQRLEAACTLWHRPPCLRLQSQQRCISGHSSAVPSPSDHSHRSCLLWRIRVISSDPAG